MVWSSLIGDHSRYFGFRIEPEGATFVHDAVTLVPCSGSCGRILVVVGRDCPVRIGWSSESEGERLLVVVDRQRCRLCVRSGDDAGETRDMKVDEQMRLIRRFFGRFVRFTFFSAGSLGKGVAPYVIVLRDVLWCRRQAYRFYELTGKELRPVWRRTVADFLPFCFYAGTAGTDGSSKVLQVFVWPRGVDCLGFMEEVF